MAIKLATGPLVSKVSKKEAEDAFRRSPDFPKSADEYVIEELDGHWVAAVHVADSPFGGPSDQDEESPGPKSEGPGDTKDDDGTPSPDGDDGGSDEGGSDDGSPDGPPKPGDEKGDEKGGEKGEIHHLLQKIDQIMVALGIPDAMAAGGSPVPGEEPPMPPEGPQGPPPGAGGPDQTVEHTKALKPGEVPPGGTPVGAPAFSHTKNPWLARGQHPWAVGKSKIIAKDENGAPIPIVATAELEEHIPEDISLADVDHELNELAYDTPFKVKQVTESRSKQGHRIAHALVSVY